jgi:hypothetical protein
MIQWWVDASFATRGECKGHTGAMTLLERGSMTEVSKKQKINSRIKLDRVGSHCGSGRHLAPNVVDKILYTRCTRGYKVEE